MYSNNLKVTLSSVFKNYIKVFSVKDSQTQQNLLEECAMISYSNLIMMNLKLLYSYLNRR
jgi:hypothetical protein